MSSAKWRPFVSASKCVNVNIHETNLLYHMLCSPPCCNYTEAGGLLRHTDHPMSSCRLQMSWRRRVARPSATNTLTQNWLYDTHRDTLIILSTKDITIVHWGRVTHICVSKLTIIGSDNGLSPGRHQAIISASAKILLTGPLETNFSEILIEIIIVSFKKMRLKVSSAIRWPFVSASMCFKRAVEWSAARWFLCCCRVSLLMMITPHALYFFRFTVSRWILAGGEKTYCASSSGIIICMIIITFCK